MPALRQQVLDCLGILSAHSGVGGAVCTAVADGKLTGVADVRNICTRSGIAQARSGETLEFLKAAGAVGLFEKLSELNWRVADPALVIELAPMLQAIHVYRSTIHEDADTVEVVLTKPPHPSQLARALQSMLLGTWGLLDTREVLPTIAEGAAGRFVVMTPFLDEVGAEIVLDLFRQVRHSVEKQLILRSTPDGDLPPGYLANAGELAHLGVKTFNFRLDKGDAPGTETFHAKVVLGDSARAYVGSSNMNKWSFQYSLELGLLVSGRAAARIGQIVDAVTKVSAQIHP